MKKKTKRSIQSQTLIFMLSYNIIIVVLGIFLISMFDINYKRQQTEKMDTIIASVKTLDFEDIDNIKELAFRNDVCVAIVDEYSKVSLYNAKLNGCGFKPGNIQVQNLMEEFKASDKDYTTYRFENKNENISAMMYAVKMDNGYAFIYSNMQDISDLTVILKQQLIAVFIIGGIIAVVMSVILSSKIMEPIVKITKKAKKLGSGNFDVTFEKSGVKEIDELSETLMQAQVEMSKTDELRRDLMANVSHDLKTPLTMIKAYAEMIRDISYKDREKMNEHLQIIEDESDRLTVLVNDILDLSKMQSNASTLNKEEFDLHDLIEEIVHRYDIIKETEKYTINVSMPDKMPIKADKNKLNQVIYNLVNNAINYTGDDKVVTIKVTKEKKSYLVEIIDTGKGIKESELPYIWDKYYKNDKLHQRNVVSTGLGLSIVKQILELHNYEYGVKSTVGKGTTFYFKIKY